MSNLISALLSLGFNVESLTLFIGMATGFFLIFYKLDKKTDKTNHKMDLVVKDVGHIQEKLSKDISHIKENLSNHITDTNKRIDKLEIGQTELRNELKENYKEIKKDVKEMKTLLNR